MMKKWIPVILCGSLLVGSVIAFASSDDQTSPNLSSVYNLAVTNELSPQEVALAYVHTLVAQRKMELTKAHIDFVKQQVKAASRGLFHHNDEETQAAVQGSLDLTQADYFAAQAEYQANLNYLNQLLGKAYSQVQAPKSDAFVASLDPRLEERYGHMDDAAQELRSAQAAYSVGHVSPQELIQKEQQLYTAQQSYWDDVQIYLTSHIKAEGAPAVIADLQERPSNSPRNHWAMAETQSVARPSAKVAELASDVRQPTALAMLKAVKAPAPIAAARSVEQVKQIELAARSVATMAPASPIVKAPTQPVLPKPEPSVSSAALEAPAKTTKKAVVQNESLKPAVKATPENRSVSAQAQHAIKRSAENKIHKQTIKPVAIHKALKPAAKKIALSKPKKLAARGVKKQVVVAKLVKAPRLANVETFHDYILPAPSITKLKLSAVDLPAPQSTKFEYV